jgi:hypothetical protein
MELFENDHSAVNVMVMKDDWKMYLHRVQNGTGAHPNSYPMGTRGFFPGGKADGA